MHFTMVKNLKTDQWNKEIDVNCKVWEGPSFAACGVLITNIPPPPPFRSFRINVLLNCVDGRA